MVRLNATAACLLGLLELGPVPGSGTNVEPDTMSGWQLYETARDSIIRFWNVTRSQIYVELPRMEAAGYVEALGERGPRDSRLYRITPSGKEAFRAWLLDWALQEPKDDQLHSPLLLTVFFGDFVPREALLRTLQEHRLRYERRLARVNQILAAIGEESRKRPPTAVLRRGYLYNDLMVQWLNTVVHDLGGVQQPDEPASAEPVERTGV
jgi:DNA-binding PadR family transcriptional regulator